VGKIRFTVPKSPETPKSPESQKFTLNLKGQVLR